jgi:hypothetical protein
MKALLLQKHDGYATEHSGVVLEAMAPYVEPGEIGAARAGRRQVLIKVRSRRSIRPT